MVFEIIGREAELASLNAFIDETEGGAAALVLEGEAGVGKSTLWGAAVEHARVRGLTVLSSRPAEAERGLGNVGLGDLLEGVIDDVLAALLTPRRRALQVALLREEASGEPVDRRTLAVAMHDALQLLSDRGPTLIAVDDVQWLDPSSSRALVFALRRLDGARCILLLARRLAEGGHQSELERALPPDRVRRLIVGPLSVGALHRFLRDRLERSFPRQTLLRIHERSGGNPFFALELASVLPVDVDPLQPLPVPETVEEVVAARISALPAAVREALALAAAVGTASESLLHRAGVATDALDAAVAARVVERESGMIRFTHPLLSSVLYDDLGEERRDVHARIAEVAEEPVLRARHLALSTDTPDADVVRLLDAAATLASDRGAPAATAELAEHALRLTPGDRPMSVVDGRSRLRMRTSPQESGHARDRSPLICSPGRAVRCAPRLSSSSPSSSTTTSLFRFSRRPYARRRRTRRSKRSSTSASPRRNASGRASRAPSRAPVPHSCSPTASATMAFASRRSRS